MEGAAFVVFSAICFGLRCTPCTIRNSNADERRAS
jgi:hypothetical protein